MLVILFVLPEAPVDRLSTGASRRAGWTRVARVVPLQERSMRDGDHGRTTSIALRTLRSTARRSLDATRVYG
jgi:hypothetical protein